MQRLFRIVALLISLACCASIAYLWHRSYLAYDQVCGCRFGRCFEIDACNGGIQLWIREPCKYAPGVGDSAEPSFKTMVADPVQDYPFTRQRWPLAETDYALARPPVFAGFKWQAWFGWEKDGPFWEWCRLIHFPYWFSFALALLATLLVAVVRLPFRRKRTGLCKACGYDLRASPVRCPECGTAA